MWKEDCSVFQHLCDICGSKFLAIKFVAEASRKLSGGKYNWSIESRLISWVITGEMPPKGIHVGLDPEIRGIEDFLSYIENRDIRLSVLASYHASVKAHHLLYSYVPDLSEFEQTRVRVLTRMIWYCCVPEKEYSNMAFEMKKKDEEPKVEEKKDVKVETKKPEEKKSEAPKKEEPKVELKKEEKKVEEKKPEPKKEEKKEEKKPEPKAEEKKVEEKKPEPKKEEKTIYKSQVVYFPSVLLHAYPDDAGFEYSGNVQVDEIFRELVRVHYVRPGIGIVIGYIALKDFNQD